jgi:DNA-binding beta-propeller fold protein YncE
MSLKLICLLTLLLYSFSLLSQEAFVKEKRDHVWLFGYSSDAMEEGFGGSVIDFNDSLPLVYEEYRDMNFNVTNASICSEHGNLLFYTNGIEIHNYLHEQMENGGGLNPGQNADDNQENGYILSQGVLILPIPNHASQYYLIHSTQDYPDGINLGFHVTSLNFSIIDMALNNGQGKVIEKNIPLIQDTLNVGEITSVRHANGRDWWLLVSEYDSNRFYRFLLSREGIINYGIQEVEEPIHVGLAQSVFSPDGTKYARLSLVTLEEDQYIDIFDFDRCSGSLGNQLQITYVDTAYAGGVAISPNSRYLYVSSFQYVYQYDLWAENIEESKQTIAIYDGFQGPLWTTLFLAQLAPDNKIYINASNSVNFLHVIHNPNAPGLACDIRQHDLELPTLNAFSLPNNPYYGLGPLDGSTCDTLGIDNHPQADFKYATETLEVNFTDYSLFNPQTWLWKFGDDQTSELQNPIHTYEQSGVYEVCLTVANENATHTACKILDLQVTSNNLESTEDLEIIIAPNPAISYLNIQFTKPMARNCMFALSNTLGEIVLLEMIPASSQSQTFNIQHLPAGIYFFNIYTDNKLFKAGKVIINII